MAVHCCILGYYRKKPNGGGGGEGGVEYMEFPGVLKKWQVEFPEVN